MTRLRAIIDSSISAAQAPGKLCSSRTSRSSTSDVLSFRTPFHADVFRSHSWSANVCGRKRWFLVRPGIEKEKIEKYWKEEHAGDSAGTNMTDIRAVLERHPELYNNGDVLEVVQEAGEVIFVPSNWHHQVHNLVSCLA